MRPIRYIGRHRNAGYGYSLVERLRREAAYWLRDHGFVWAGYRLDFNRDRYLDNDHDVEDHWPHEHGASEKAVDAPADDAMA